MSMKTFEIECNNYKFKQKLKQLKGFWGKKEKECSTIIPSAGIAFHIVTCYVAVVNTSF